MMSTFEETATVNASPEMVFSFVSDIRNLPRYLPTLRHATRQGPGRVQVEGEAKGNPYVSDGRFQVDEMSRRMDWGSDGENRYSGWLVVQPEEEGSRITVHLAFEPRQDQAALFASQTGSSDGTIRDGLQAALASIKNICEGLGGKVESRAAA